MRRSLAAALVLVSSSCSLTHSADDFSACDEQCEDQLPEWTLPAPCEGDVADAIDVALDQPECAAFTPGQCLAGTIVAIGEPLCEGCVLLQTVECAARIDECLCQSEAYNCCRARNGCGMTGMCPVCDPDGLAMLECVATHRAACRSVWDVCSR